MLAHNLIKDTTFGYLLRALLGPSVLPHPDELDVQNVYGWSIDKRRSPSVDNAEFHEQGASPAPTDVRTSGVTFDADEKVGNVVVGWYGSDDPDNPQNWSSAKKVWVLFQTCYLTFAVYIGSSIYTGGIKDVEAQFNVSQVAATLGLTMFVLGYGAGPMFFAPLSELPQIGRLPIYMGTLVAFVLFLIPTALATNFGMLLAFRFLTGFFASPALANGGATIADMISPKRRAYAIYIWGIGSTCGPVLGPLLGSFSAHAKGWTWTMWVLMWLSGSALVLLFFFFPETSPDNILYRRAQRLRQATGDHTLRAQSEIDASQRTARERLTASMVMPIVLNFTEPIVLVLNIYIGLVYALLYLWFESFPIVFVGIYHFEEQLLGLSYLGIFSGALLSVFPFFAYLRYIVEPRYARGDPAPEERMLIASYAAPVVAIALFWFGWSARESVHWIVPIIGTSLFGISILLICNIVLNYLADVYPTYAASVLASNGLMRSAFGATFPLFAHAMYDKLGVGWASTLLGLLACAFVPIPVFLYCYGERIRLISKRARHDYVN
ncbi:unnamed protein product [Peniophora sp. CBMAI 1063]|nr:unnamed protein product [Peniophora sp. CBMAI 1063]